MEIERKINVLFVLIQLAAGGSERVALDLAKNLDRSKFNVYAAYFSNGILRRAFEHVCQEIFQIQKKAGFDLRVMLNLSSIIRNKGIHVINAHHYMPFFYSYLGGKILHKRKLFYTEHSVPEVKSILSGKHKHLFSLMLRNTDGVIGVSREIGETLKKAFPRYSEKIQSIVNGVDVARFVTSVDRNELRSKWGILPEHFVIGTVANFRKVKNHVCLIRAFNSLSLIYPNIRLILVGRGCPKDRENTEEEIRQLIHKYNLESRVIITGYRDDIPNILKCFDVFCLPSFSEGLPVSILEAMASGVPVIGSNVRGIREVIFPNKTGLLFESNNENSLVKALEQLIQNESFRKSLSNSGFKFVSDVHGIRQWVSKYESLFSS